jgi:UDP-N-acetyl-2-amino-2-deoxyglucuronate dehydrogenase
MEQKYKIALVGCGRISKNHFEAIEKLSDRAEISTVCDTNEERAKNWADKYKVPYYTDHQELIKKEKIDIVDICTPSGLHPTIGIDFAYMKDIKAVITEKPMSVEINPAKDFIKACAKNKVQLFVVKQNRLNPAVKLLKEAIDSGRFGKIYLFNTTIRWQRPQEYYDQDSWRGTRDLDGGAFMNQASHYVDAVQWLLGPVKSVLSRTEAMARNLRGNAKGARSLLDNRDIEDSGIAILNFEQSPLLISKKTLGTIEVTMCAYPKNLEGSITILGEKGSVKIGGTSLNKIETWEFLEPHAMDNKIAEASTEPPSVYGFGHLGYIKNVLDILDGKTTIKETHTPDGLSGLSSLKLLNAIYKSSLMQKEVHVGKMTIRDRLHKLKIKVRNYLKEIIDLLYDSYRWIRRLFV